MMIDVSYVFGMIGTLATAFALGWVSANREIAALKADAINTKKDVDEIKEKLDKIYDYLINK